MSTVADQETKRLAPDLETTLDVLLVVTSSLQLGAVATRLAGRRRPALALAGTNTALALALSLMEYRQVLQGHAGMEPGRAAFFVLPTAAAIAAGMGLGKRKESGWLFWPVWLWNFVMIYALVVFRLFFRVSF
jgi:hypothetical protein